MVNIDFMANYKNNVLFQIFQTLLHWIKEIGLQMCKHGFKKFYQKTFLIFQYKYSTFKWRKKVNENNPFHVLHWEMQLMHST